MVLSVSNMTKSFADRVILKDVNLTIEEHDRIGLIGANGAGKTTLLNIIAEHAEYDSGEVAVDTRTSIGYLHQNTGLNRQSAIYEEMLSVFSELKAIEEHMRSMERRMAILDHDSQEYRVLSEDYARSQAFFEAREGYQIDVKIKTVLTGMGFSDKAYSTPIFTLSGGEKTRLALAKLLLEEPSLLILDEPTNHLDFRTLSWLEDYLQGYKGSLLVVSHDRYFLDRMVTKIWEVSHQKVYTYKGNYTKYKQLKAERIARELKEYEQQQNKLASMQEYVDRNLVRASTSNSAKSRIHQMEHMERLEKPQLYDKTPNFRFTYTREPVKDVLLGEGITLRVGDADHPKQLLPTFDFNIRRGERIALIGPNGIGKSTLLKTLLGQNQLSSGEIHWGRNVQIAYYEQENLNLNFDNSVLEELWSRWPNLMESQVRGILGQMLISDDNVYKPIRVISGGERARLGFAVMVTEHANTLLFDEPTNHLDLASKEALEKALSEFTGTLLFVSHDRYFLNSIPTKIVEMTPEGLQIYEGNYDDYLEQSKARAMQTQKPQAQEKKPSAGAQSYHRSKQQRAEDAKRRNRISALEKQMEALDAEIERLQEEMADPEVAVQYERLQEICARLDEAKQENEDAMTEWMMLQEEQEGRA